MVNDMARFNKFVDKSSGDCWTWTGARLNPRGYGAFCLRGKNTSAHRASYVLFVGPIPKGVYVCHECDNPACVRPEHLFLGTPRDNWADAVSKGRINPVPPPSPWAGGVCEFNQGQRNRNAKLDDAAVREIRRLHLSGESGKSISARIGVARSTVSMILNSRTWKHVV